MQSLYSRIPLIGILVFSVIYIVAAYNYPGGTNTNQHSKGFDWLGNYWCDLTSEIAKNGEHNSARPIALTGMFWLCGTLSFFWFSIADYLSDLRYKKMIFYSGLSSMLITLFLFTSYHDMVINVAGALGFFALIVAFIGFYRKKLYGLFAYGVFCLSEMFFNFFIYKSSLLIPLQPIIQKLTFVFFFSWIIWACLIVSSRSEYAE